MKSLYLILTLCLVTSASFGESFSEYSVRVAALSDAKKNDGMSSMLSGGIALLGGTYGWSRAEKSVEKGFYSLAQSIGILAIGFGAESYFLRQDEEIFLQVLSAADISRDQKDKMVESYVRERKEREENTLWIRRTTFGLAGLLNVIYAAQTKDQTLQNFLYVTSGVQLVWAFTF